MKLIRETDCGELGWINPAHKVVQLRNVLKRQRNFGIQKKGERFLNSWVTTSFAQILFYVDLLVSVFRRPKFCDCRSQWPRGLRRRSEAARLLRAWIWIPPGAWMFVCCGCFVLSGRGLCDELITRPEESYRLWCVVVCDLEKTQEWGGHDPRWVAAQKKNLWLAGTADTQTDWLTDGQTGWLTICSV